MSTPAQLAANQTNAQSSTGPLTPEGKAASAANSTKHGFYGKHAVLLNDQERTQFESLRNSYVYALNPTTIVEVTLLDLLVLAAWNIEHTNRLEAEIANAEGIDPLLSATNAQNSRTHPRLPCPRRTHIPQVPQRAAGPLRHPHHQNRPK